MSAADYMPELASALDRLVPDDAVALDWDDVVGRAGRRRRRVASRRVRLVLAVALLLLLMTGVATATYLLVRGGNGKIAFDGGYRKLLIADPNGPGLQAIAGCAAATPSCGVVQPAWSQDGGRIAFVGGRLGGPRSSGRMALYVAASGGRATHRLAGCGGCGEQWGARLGWSPDGRWIAFSRDAGARGQESLWVVASTGGRPRRVTDCRPAWCADIDPAWSPDGRVIVFQRIAPVATNTLYTVSPNGTNLTRIAGGADPHWSPDGTKIAFDGAGGIAVAKADGSNVRLLFAEPGGTGPGAPSWSPDGSKIVFFRTPGRPGHFRAEVWTMNADGSAKKRLYRSGCCVMGWAAPIWSPDGRLIAFSANSAGGTFVMNADGSGLRRLSRDTSGDLSWQSLTRH